MPPLFTKFHGFGNDYLVILSDELREASGLGEFAKRICNRHYGAGADGIAVVSAVENANADFQVRIFNPDGSEAGLSGNGTRCAAAYLHYTGKWANKELRLATRTGVKKYFLREQLNEGKYLFDSELGKPVFEPSSIPMIVCEPLQVVRDYPLSVGNETFDVTALQIGNPVCSLFVDDFESIDWRLIGKKIEIHPQFPERTNVVFVRPINRDAIELRIWERGVGETSASGTCSCAGAVASMMKDLTGRSVDVLTPGGKVQVQWRADDEVVITGTAEVVYTADWLAPT